MTWAYILSVFSIGFFFGLVCAVIIVANVVRRAEKSDPDTWRED